MCDDDPVNQWGHVANAFNLHATLANPREFHSFDEGLRAVVLSNPSNGSSVLIFPSGTQIMKFAARLVENGVSFSVVDAPDKGSENFEREARDMLSDWGLV